MRVRMDLKAGPTPSPLLTRLRPLLAVGATSALRLWRGEGRGKAQCWFSLFDAFTAEPPATPRRPNRSLPQRDVS
jgi:hypothetical protein